MRAVNLSVITGALVIAINPPECLISSTFPMVTTNGRRRKFRYCAASHVGKVENTTSAPMKSLDAAIMIIIESLNNMIHCDLAARNHFIIEVTGRLVNARSLKLRESPFKASIAVSATMCESQKKFAFHCLIENV